MQSKIVSIQKGFIFGDNLNNKGLGIMGGSERRENQNLEKKECLRLRSFSFET